MREGGCEGECACESKVKTSVKMQTRKRQTTCTLCAYTNTHILKVSMVDVMLVTIMT